MMHPMKEPQEVRMRYEEGEMVILKSWGELAVDYPVTLDEEGDEEICLLHEGTNVWGSDKHKLGGIVKIVKCHELANDYWVMEHGGFVVCDFMIKRPINKHLDPECYI